MLVVLDDGLTFRGKRSLLIPHDELGGVVASHNGVETGLAAEDEAEAGELPALPEDYDFSQTDLTERPAGEDAQDTEKDEHPTQTATVAIQDPRSMTDAEKKRRGDLLRETEALHVDKGTITAGNGLSARKAAEKWWEENVPEPVLYNTEAGEVEINRNSVESSLAHRYGQAKLDAISSLPEGFGNAVYLGTMPDSRERGVVDHYFAYPIEYDGKRCYVFCRVMQDGNKNRLYVHEVFVSDNIKKGDTLQTAASKPRGGISLYRDILANVLYAGKGTETSVPVQAEGTESSGKGAVSAIPVKEVKTRKGVKRVKMYHEAPVADTIADIVGDGELDTAEAGELIGAYAESSAKKAADVAGKKPAPVADADAYKVEKPLHIDPFGQTRFSPLATI